MSLLSWIKNLFAPKPAPTPAELGRNEPCWCGSGKKYKKCHLAKDERDRFEAAHAARAAAQARKAAGLGGGAPAAPKRPEKLMEDRKK